MAFSDYSSTPSSNVSIAGINVAEGCAPANLNDAIRQMMADAKTFSETAVSTSDNVTISATFTYTAAQDYNDGVAARFGTDHDLTIQHTGTDSRIIHDGTGDLVLRSNNNILFRNEDASETFAQMTEDGAVTLYYDNSAKIATASAGVSVTGGIVATTDIMLTEAADHTNTPAAGKLILWVKNDTPNVLKVTDDAGTDFTVATTQGIDAGKFTSTAQTITAAGTLTLPHSLGARPPLLNAWLVNVTGELGYTTGQTVNVPVGADQSSGTNNLGFSCIADATNLTIRFGSNAQTFVINHATTGVSTGITNANWTIVFHARL